MFRRCSIVVGLAGVVLGCSSSEKTPALAKAQQVAIPTPSPSGPRLGAIAGPLPVFDRPSRDGAVLGLLRVGGQVARAEKAFSKEGCASGWFPVYPRGVVCLEQGATLDARHPTLSATPPSLEGPMPYAYARSRGKTAILEMTAAGPRPAGELPIRAGIAMIGSAQSTDARGKSVTLAMLPDGRYVDASGLDPARYSDFQGVELADSKSLPVGFIVKDDVKPIKVNGGKVEVQDSIERGRVEITGKFHMRNNERYWAVADGTYIRNRDLVVVSRKEKFPEFVKDDTRWIDVSITMNTLTLYEGKRPLFVTLVTTGVDRVGGSNSTTLGTFTITTKYITAPAGKPFDLQADVRDAPWALQLSSGQFIHGSYWISRFGIGHGPGNLQLSPVDALRVWKWIDAAIPDGWQGTDIPEDKRVTVLVRK